MKNIQDRKSVIDEIEKLLLTKLVTNEESTIDRNKLVETYMLGGREAIEKVAKSLDWIYFRVTLGELKAHYFLSHYYLPILEKLDLDQNNWWYIEKYDEGGVHLRIRILATLEQLNDILLLEKHIKAVKGVKHVNRLIYEPELRIFGGKNGLELAHDFFSADSKFITKWYEIREGNLSGLKGLSLFFIRKLLVSSYLDPFEQWDVWNNIYSQRCYIPDENLNLDYFNNWLGKIYQIEEEHIDNLFPTKQEQECIKNYLNFLNDFGKRLYTDYQNGEIQRGVRAFLSAVILFHWNRIGLDYYTQAGISRALMLKQDPLTNK
ncbi:thiopeptide-type bacteriocin biosynthesis protein [Ornithinibacillus halotolerans]|nr:thiopeptide-type bacteriocin biosynthesis protein [Ornithinibacillus halotolerans]